MRRIRSLLIPAMILGPALVLAGGITRYVDGTNGVDTPGGGGTPGTALATIQFAYDLSADGDTIRVLPGTYDECVAALDSTGRSIHIEAEDWANPPMGTSPDNTTTILDGGTCGGATPVVTLGGRVSTLVGFTVRNGTDSGILAFGGPTITDNVVHNNEGVNGGGIYVYTATCSYEDVTATIANNDVFDNEAVEDPDPDASDFDGLGGGIGVFASARGINDGFLPNCQVQGNPTVIVDRNTVSDNQAVNGGGIWVRTDSTLPGLRSAVTITSNLVGNNQAGTQGPMSSGRLGWGGGIYSVTYGYGTEEIKIGDLASPGSGNTVTDNLATGGGGGVAAFDDTLFEATHTTLVEDNEVTLNQVDTQIDDRLPSQARGGGILVSSRAIDLQAGQSIGTSVAGNDVSGNVMTGIDGRGGGISVRLRSLRTEAPAVPLGVVVENNSIRDNESVVLGGGVALESLADTGDPGDSIILPATAPITFRNNLVADNQAADPQGSGGFGGGAHVSFDCCDGVFLGSCTAGAQSSPATCSVTMEQNTITRNTAGSDEGSGGVEIVSITEPVAGQASATIEISNSIVSSNTGYGIGGPPANLLQTNYDIRYSDIWGNTDPMDPADDTANFESTIPDQSGNENLEQDPLLSVPTANPPYAPNVCSPVIDRANPASAFALEPVPNGSRANMGYTGGTANASISPVDLNGDGKNDGQDVVIFATTFSSSVGDPRYILEADFDGNGMVEPSELSALLAGFGCTVP